jgi:outer membrane cobalamin receptor
MIWSGTCASGIEGTVLNKDRVPISDAEVRLVNTVYSDITDEKGHFQITDIPAGRYDLLIKHISFQKQTVKSVLVTKGAVTGVGNIVLEFGIFNSENVIITATRTEHQPIDLVQQVNSIASHQIIERASKTSAEALREESGVFIQKTNHGGGSAIIRGLSSNRILLLVDGIRLNNSVYRLGNHQYLTTVDHNMLNRIEVLRGPGSVQYGSDALGGVINLRTKTPAFTDGEMILNYRMLSRFSSADNEKTGRSEFSIRDSRMAFQGGFSYKSFDDLRRGRNSHRRILENSGSALQSPSGYSGTDFDIKFHVNMSPHQKMVAAWQKSARNEVPRYDKYENSDYHKWIYDPQDRDLLYLKYTHTRLSPVADQLSMSVSFHKQTEGRLTQKSIASPQIREKDGVTTLGFTTQFNSYLPNQLITYGFDAYSDKVKSERYITDTRTGSRVKEARGRYPDNAQYQHFGFYVQDEVSLLCTGRSLSF